jgi:hypothetical protein
MKSMRSLRKSQELSVGVLCRERPLGPNADALVSLWGMSKLTLSLFDVLNLERFVAANFPTTLARSSLSTSTDK